MLKHLLIIFLCLDTLEMDIHNMAYGQVIEPMFMKEKVIRNYTFYTDYLDWILKYAEPICWDSIGSW